VRALRSMVLFHDAVAARRAAAVREPGAAMMVRPFVIGGRGEPALGLPPVGRLSALSHITVMHTVPGELTGVVFSAASIHTIQLRRDDMYRTNLSHLLNAYGQCVRAGR
jgi:hypothetical protein